MPTPLVRAALVVLLLVALAIPSPGHAQAAGRYAAMASATVNHNGITKFVWLQAVQHAPGEIPASGGLIMIQIDPTGAFGDFSMLGHVACMKVEAGRALIGMNAVWGLGTTRPGSIFYIAVEDSAAGKFFDNGGWEGPGTPDCNTTIGMPGGGSPVVQGNVSVFVYPD
jgi:hypothetical protein